MVDEYFDLLFQEVLLASPENKELAHKLFNSELDFPKHWLTILINAADGEDVASETWADYIDEAHWEE